MEQYSELQVLTDLGLTLVQAKVYLALVESGPLITAEISKISNIARPDVYSNLSKLQLLGLVEKLIETPVKYRAIPVNEGLSLLLRTKTEQYEKLKAETRVLLETNKTQKPNNKDKKADNPQFVLIPQGETVINRMKTAIENAQFSIDLVLSWRRFSRGMACTFAESIEIAWAKNVKTRFIIEKPLKSKTATELIYYCMRKPCCQIRFISDYPETIFGIYDKKEIFLIVFSQTDLPGSPALWSNNRSLIALAENHFEAIWKTAVENTN